MTRVWREILPLGVGELRMANNFLSLVLNLYAPHRKINQGKLNPTWTGIDWPKLNKADRGGPAKPNVLVANSILLEFLPEKWTADAILKRLGQSASQTPTRNTSSRQTSISDTHTHAQTHTRYVQRNASAYNVQSFKFYSHYLSVPVWHVLSTNNSFDEAHFHANMHCVKEANHQNMSCPSTSRLMSHIMIAWGIWQRRPAPQKTFVCCKIPTAGDACTCHRW